VEEVPKNHRGLYCVEHDLEIADLASDELTLDQFHHQMGHISQEIARKLVSQGFVTGVCLDTTDSGKTLFCESYSSLQNCPNVWHVETNWLVTQKVHMLKF